MTPNPAITDPNWIAEIPTELIPAVPSTAGMTTKVVKGSLWTLLGQVAPLAVSLVTTPFVIRGLGPESYGVFILIALIPAYLVFGDLGMGMASTKFASEAYAKGDGAKEARIVRTAAVISMCSSLPLALALFLLSSSLMSLFNVPLNLAAEGSLGLKFGAVTFILGFLNLIFNTPQLTRLRMDLNTLVNASFRILGLIGVPFAIYYSGLVGGVVMLMLAAAGTLVGHFVVSARLNPLLIGFTIDRSTIVPMLKFGGHLALAGVAATVLVNSEKGLLSSTASVRALAHYSVAYTVAGMLTMFASAMSQSLVPAFSQLRGDPEPEKINQLFVRGIKISLIALFPAVLVLSLVAKPFFTIWAGREFGQESTQPFYVLLIGVIFNVLCYLPYSVLLAEGRTGTLAILFWIELVPYAILVWFLTARFGAVGAAAAWTIRMAIETVVIFGFARNLTRQIARKLDLATLALAAAVLFVPTILGILIGSVGAGIGVLSAVCLCIYAFLVWSRILDEEEISWLNSRLPFALRK